MPAPKHPWLEDDDEFEGVGAHRDNPRYDPVDEDGFDDVTGEPIPGWEPPFPPHNPDFPDVNPATGDERKTTEGPADAAP